MCNHSSSCPHFLLDLFTSFLKKNSNQTWTRTSPPEVVSPRLRSTEGYIIFVFVLALGCFLFFFFFPTSRTLLTFTIYQNPCMIPLPSSCLASCSSFGICTADKFCLGEVIQLCFFQSLIFQVLSNMSGSFWIHLKPFSILAVFSSWASSAKWTDSLEIHWVLWIFKETTCDSEFVPVFFHIIMHFILT